MKNQRVKYIVFILLLAFSFSSFSQTLKFDEVSEVKPLKRGKEYSVKWSGGAKDQSIKIELHNARGKVQSWDETLNDGEDAVKLNSRLKPGSNYSFKILAGSELVSSQNVQIKRRIPFMVTISTLVAVPIFIILLSTSSDGPPPTAEAPSLPPFVSN